MSIFVFLSEEEKIINLRKTYDEKLQVIGFCDTDDFVKEMKASIFSDTDWLLPNTLRVISKQNQKIYVNYWPINKKISINLRVNNRSSTIDVFVGNLISVFYMNNGLVCSYIGTCLDPITSISDETKLYPTNLPNTYNDLSICWGSGLIAREKNQTYDSYINDVMNSFLTSTFNDDLSCSTTNRKKPYCMCDEYWEWINFHKEMIDANKVIVSDDAKRKFVRLGDIIKELLGRITYG